MKIQYILKDFLDEEPTKIVKNGEKIKGVQRAGGMRQAKPAGLQGQRSCHGNFGKLVWKVGNAVTFPIHIMPKNQSLSFD